MSAIQVSGLVAGHAGVPVVRNLDLHVDAGEVVALLGPNGAGKSTTIHTIAGLIPALEGSVQVLGEQIRANRPHLVTRRGFALVPESRGLFFQLTVGDNLRLAQRRAGGSIDDVLDLFPLLRPILRRRCGLLSGGEQQMLGLAKALASDPKVIAIDEMSLGLAPLIVESLLPIVRSMATERGMAVLIVEQHVGMALACADRAYVLRHGELALEGPACDLSRADLEQSYLGGAG